jgi:hypothetical protein
MAEPHPYAARTREQRRRVSRTSRKAIKRGEIPVFRVEIASRTVPEMPWLEFDGNGPPAVAEAARRAIAAELRVRPGKVEVAVEP